MVGVVRRASKRIEVGTENNSLGLGFRGGRGGVGRSPGQGKAAGGG